MSNTSTYPLRLPTSVKSAAEKLAKEEGISLNQFVATAVAEKLSAMNTAAFFLERKERADFEAFRAILTRQGGESPRDGDNIVS
ncbi:MAG: toxin-antitoxin system HicB family antitoxin [Proteobacteria bacterium]|nr:toxin-antitoxin system HicB family antitoxin [Pseudomonadota bacterium]